MDALFAPLIHPSRMTSYQPTDFTFASAVVGAAEITFTPLEREDDRVPVLEGQVCARAGVEFYQRSERIHRLGPLAGLRGLGVRSQVFSRREWLKDNGFSVIDLLADIGELPHLRQPLAHAVDLPR